MASRIAQLATALETRLADATVTFTLGQLALRENLTTRRVAIVPVKADHQHQHDVGGRVVGGTPQTRQPAFLTRNLRLDLYIWDGTTPTDGLTTSRLEATETLLHAVMVALRAEFLGAMRFLGEEWHTQTERSAGYEFAAELVVLHVSAEVPVVFESKPLTVIAHQLLTGVHVTPTGGTEDVAP